MTGHDEGTVRYEAAEKPPHALSAALGAQSVALIISGIVFTPVIVLRAGNADEATTAWSIFAALLVSGLTTVLQARPVWRIGAGYVLFMGTSGAFISVGIEALLQGGAALLMTLIVASSLLQFPLAANLGVLRRIVTPTVGGTCIMLIAVTVMPIVFRMLEQLPESAADSDPLGAPAAALVTLLVILGVSLFGARRWRLWSPLFGLLAGTAVAAGFGLYDAAPVDAAGWLGLPDLAWPGLDLGFGPAFWALLPGFLIVTVVGAIETFGDGIAIQRVSFRKPRAVDFRAVQGAVYADGLGNLLSGLAGTLPNTTYSTSISVVEMTGVAARRVAIWGGLFLLLLAFSPKVAALLLAVPNPVVAAYILVLLVMLFMHGLHLALEEGATFETSLVVGMSLWLGIGFQDKAVFYDLLPSWAASLLSNGMTTGTLVAVLMTLMLRLKGGRRERLQTRLETASLPAVQDFLQGVARGAGWDRAATHRLQLAAEETLLVMLEHAAAGAAPRQLRVEARRAGALIELDIVVGPLGANLSDAMAEVAAAGETPAEDAISFRILRSIVEEMRHQQYHGIDFITLKVGSRPL
jgi:NCS2 family nucleobase:cation symporter-2/xanthine permease XanP